MKARDAGNCAEVLVPVEIGGGSARAERSKYISGVYDSTLRLYGICRSRSIFGGNGSETAYIRGLETQFGPCPAAQPVQLETPIRVHRAFWQHICIDLRRISRPCRREAQPCREELLTLLLRRTGGERAEVIGCWERGTAGSGIGQQGTREASEGEQKGSQSNFSKPWFLGAPASDQGRGTKGFAASGKAGRAVPAHASGRA